MTKKLSHQFFASYLIVFLLSLFAGACSLLLLSFADSVLSKTLMKSSYPAASLMRDDYARIDATGVVQSGGGVQVIDQGYRVVYSEGLDTLKKQRLTAAEFTDFLVQSKSKGVPYHYDIAYNQTGEFWLVVTFPTSIRLDFSVAYNPGAASKDMRGVAAAFALVLLSYLLMLAVFAAVYSNITSARIARPLRKLCEGARLLREGDYAARVDLRLKNEFAELQDTFNDMAERIEHEIALRKRSEDDRRRLILDISHDLKNPLASIAGYAERCLARVPPADRDQRDALGVIYQNSRKADRLLTELFELSKLESPEFVLRTYKTDVCETLRQICGELLPSFEQAGFLYEFEIPDEAHEAMIDPGQLSRVFGNLADNAVRYNPPGTTVSVGLSGRPEGLVIGFCDDGIGMPADVAEDIFKPFVRADDSRNSKTGGSGLGLSIAQKIVQAHGGTLTLETAENRGCMFTITLPAI